MHYASNVESLYCTVQLLSWAMLPEVLVEVAVVDAVLTASRTLVAVATRSLGAAAENTTIAQYRMLVVLASRGPQRIGDLAAALDVAPSTAGRMTDRLVRKQLVRRHRARTDRRSVLVSVTAAGRLVVDEATVRRRVLIEDILARMPADQQRAVGNMFQRHRGDIVGRHDVRQRCPVDATARERLGVCRTGTDHQYIDAVRREFPP